MAPLASVPELARYMQLTQEELPTTADALLQLATDLILEEAPAVARFAAPPARARAVCLEVVARFLGNPDALESQEIGNYTERAGAVPDGLYLTKSDSEQLLRYRGGGAGTLTLTPPGRALDAEPDWPFS